MAEVERTLAVLAKYFPRDGMAPEDQTVLDEYVEEEAQYQQQQQQVTTPAKKVTK